MEIGTFVVVRTQNAGAFAGTLAAQNGEQVTLTDARRLWYWDGAATLSEVALSGVSKPRNCKFPAPVDVDLTQVIEVLAATEEARESIAAVPVWSARA